MIIAIMPLHILEAAVCVCVWGGRWGVAFQNMWIYKRLWACVSELVRGLWVNPAAVVGERKKKKQKKKNPTVASYDMSTPSTSRNGPKGWNANVLIKSEGFRNSLWKEKKKKAIWLVITVGGELCKMRRASFSKGRKSSIPISAFSCPPIIHCPSETLAFFSNLSMWISPACVLFLCLFFSLSFFCYQKPAL